MKTGFFIKWKLLALGIHGLATGTSVGLATARQQALDSGALGNRTGHLMLRKNMLLVG